MFTINKPVVTAKTVDTKYKAMVFEPILESFDMSLKLATPLISDAKTKGTAINFKRLINIVPNGLIQSLVN